MRSLRSLASALILIAALAAVGCDRPLTVDVSPQGAEKIALRGKTGVRGTLGRSLNIDGRVYDKGTGVVVGETWLVRKEKGEPPAYRVTGHYDPSEQTEGFVLPANAVNVYFLSMVEPDRVLQIPVPSEYFVPVR